MIWDWTGFPGAPGVTSIYADTEEPEAVGVAFDDFLRAVATTSIPDIVTITLRSEYEVLDEATGTLESVGTFGGVTPINCAGTGGYSAASGMVLSWTTGGLVAGHRVRGRTFVVPLSAGAYEENGTLKDVTLATHRSQLATFMTAAGGHQVIWSRPRAGLAGSAHAVTAGTIRDKVAVLRSRRD